MDVLLSQICPIQNPNQYKLHLACYNQKDNPLDVFVRDRKEWDGWNSWRGKRDEFNREFIFALIDFYPQKDRWLFGGVYRVISRKPINGPSYEIERVAEYESFVGRLKITLKRPSRAKSVNFEKHYHKLIVSEILATPYTGEAFPGYDWIDLAFPVLHGLILQQRSDWKTALENVKGVYLVTDDSNGKRYVGAAYNEDGGIWSRWECYVCTGHGKNEELTEVINKNGIDYARKNFRFSLLEHFAMKTEHRTITEREKHWKQVLRSRGPYGYNKN